MATGARKGRKGVSNLREQVNPDTTRAWDGPLPTPTAGLANHGGPNQRDSSGRPGLEMAARMYPTPRANDGEKRGRIADDPRNGLPAYVLFQTPTVPNGGRTLHHVDEWRGNTPYYKGKKVQVDLQQQIKLWQTPTASDAGRGGSAEAWFDFKNGGKTNGAKLRNQMQADKLLPTPTARDFKSPDLNPDSQRFQQKTELNSVIGGQLNPDWVDWLMGYPVGWTALDTPVELPPAPSDDEWWADEPEGVPRVACGIPNRADRLQCDGNGVVPQQFYPIFRAIAEVERA